MDAGLKAWAEIVRQVYPDLPILRDRTQWLAGSFERPSVFIETDLVSDKVHTPRADRIIEDVGLVFHFDKERMTEEDEGEPIPFDLTPFFTFLRKRRFCYSSQRFGVALVIEPPRTRPEKTGSRSPSDIRICLRFQRIRSRRSMNSTLHMERSVHLEYKTKRKDDSAASVHLDLNKRTKQEWIEGAAALKHERFEVAGALLIANQMNFYLSKMYKADWMPTCVRRQRRRKR